MNWKKYIDARFVNPFGTIKTRDRVPFVCGECQKVTILYVANVQARIKKYGTYICRSCMGKIMWRKNRAKMKATMLKKYGVDNIKRRSK
jgi:predicted SprT family Zn-dependent metalloprotease